VVARTEVKEGSILASMQAMDENEKSD